jgi:hypothetical protein
VIISHSSIGDIPAGLLAIGASLAVGYGFARLYIFIACAAMRFLGWL